jgi:hypothetical protein
MDRTAQTEPLTTGQSIVAKWESPASPWSEPADLAEAIDKAIAAEREACAKIADDAAASWDGKHGRSVAYGIRDAIRARST